MELIEIQKLLDIQELKFNDRFAKMGTAFIELKNSVNLPERKYYVAPYTSDSTNELDAAHAKSFAKLTCVPREAAGNRGKYAKVEHIAKYVNPIIGEFGLSVKQLLGHNEYGEDILITRLSHLSGQWVESRIILKEENTQGGPNQKFGASITYTRRYAFLAILGIGSIDDPSDVIE